MCSIRSLTEVVRSAKGKGPTMVTVRIGPTGSATVHRLLREVGRDSNGLSGSLSADADHWAPLMNREMEQRDVEVVARLLRNLGAASGLSVSRQDRARYWAEYLEGRM
jgi:hypothetical protein